MEDEIKKGNKILGKSNIAKGKKWADKKRQLELQKLDNEIEWMDKQPSIVADIKAYKDSLKPVEKEKLEPTKPKGKK